MASFYSCDECKSIFLDMSPNTASCEAPGIKPLQAVGKEDERHKLTLGMEDGKLAVSVGDATSDAGHAVQWLYVDTSFGGVRCDFNPGDEPSAVLGLEADEVVQVYAYCPTCGLMYSDAPAAQPSFEQNEVACSPEFALGCVNELENEGQQPS